MNITEIRVKLTMDPRNKLKGYCSLTFDDAFVVRDLKIIDGVRGPFVAMPSRKLCDRCRGCGAKNCLTASFCNQCGKRLDPSRAPRDHRGRAKLHADLAHPINSACRIELHRAVVKAFAEEVERSQQSDYVPPTFDDFDDAIDFLDEDYLDELAQRQAAREGAREGARSRSRHDAGHAQHME
ncbi:MAG: septation protein SpoVG family protein [Planctomycetes bacterium]|nr:septation protein SpoVG family protein [Planctomycetota bacterium]